MRRMNYPRFDKPTYVGTYDTAQISFVMNGIPELGIYFVIIKNPEGMQQNSCTFTVAMGLNTSCSWFSVGAGEQIYLDYNTDDGNVISVSSETGNTGLGEGSTIELYKLN